jgi:hypothetical protein
MEPRPVDIRAAMNSTIAIPPRGSAAACGIPELTLATDVLFQLKV